VQPVVDWLATVVGAAFVGLALRDIFHTLWHPTGRGALSRLVMSAVWRAGRRGRRRGPGGGGALGGPVAMVLVVLTWTLLVVLGGALVHWPHLEGGFSLSSGLDPDRRGGLLDAVYVSLVTTATLGFGDIVPTAAWLRVVVPVQALIGFALLTAAVTWGLGLYPALVRRRTLALRIAALRRIDTAAMLAGPDGTLAVQVLYGLAAAFAQARVDVTQYAETYYFRDASEETALPAMVAVAADLADVAGSAPDRDVRLAGDLLSHALADYMAVIDAEFLDVSGPMSQQMRAYAADHGFHRGGQVP
jgi:hypothetical protein